jgi:uncharacterized Ntn-hydrolase superfamily protein
VTYSIVAHDPATGDLGVAAQSHFFNVGAHVLFAEPGVGIVLTQMMATRAYGTRGISLMSEGRTAKESLDATRALDPGQALAQVAMLDAHGGVAVHTGAHCVAHSAHAIDEGVTAQAAMCSSPATAHAMIDAFRSSTAPLARRLLTALDAAERTGGDLRGQRAATLVVVAGRKSAEPWHDRRTDLRVEDSSRPLDELRRLLTLHELHSRGNMALELALGGKLEDALAIFAELEGENPDDPDVAFRHALVLALAGSHQKARKRLDRCYNLHRGWRQVVKRLPAAGILPDDAALMATLLGEP